MRRPDLVKHPRFEEITDALLSSGTYVEIAAGFEDVTADQLAKYARSEHWRNHINEGRIPFTLVGVDLSPKPGDPVKAPRNVEQVIAYCMHLAYTQRVTEAAAIAGVSRATAFRWEQCSWFGSVQRQVLSRFCNGLVADAHRSAHRLLKKDDPKVTMFVLERLYSDKFGDKKRDSTVEEIADKLASALTSMPKGDDLAERIRNQDPETYARLVEDGLIEETTDDDSME